MQNVQRKTLLILIGLRVSRIFQRVGLCVDAKDGIWSGLFVKELFAQMDIKIIIDKLFIAN